MVRDPRQRRRHALEVRMTDPALPASAPAAPPRSAIGGLDMDEHDTPIQTTNPGTAPGRRGARRAISALLLSAGLLAVGGTAAVLAADPTPTPVAPSSAAPTDGGGTDEDT